MNSKKLLTFAALLVLITTSIVVGVSSPAQKVASNSTSAPCLNDPFGLGAARNFAVLGLDPPSPGTAADFDIGTTATTITGDFGIGPNNTGTLNKGTLNGKLYIDPTSGADTSNVGGDGFPVSGNTQNQSLADASDAALAASTYWAGEAATYPGSPLAITGTTTFTLTNSSTNIVEISSLGIVGSTITIVGDSNPATTVVFNVGNGEFIWNGGHIVLSGGITPAQILWNFPTTTGLEITISKPDATFAGTILSPYRGVSLDKSSMNGAILGGAHILIHSAATLAGSVCNAPNPSTCAPATISANFNGTSINAGRYLWFNSHFTSVNGLPSSGTVTLHLTNSTIAMGAETLIVPDSDVVFTDTVTTATTTYQSGKWVTTVPLNYGGNVFLAGLPYQVPSTIPGGSVSPSWSMTLSSATPGLSFSWQWSAAVYTSFSSDPSLLGVKPVDGDSVSQYHNSDHAGTPENYKSYVIGGARGGGGSNFTGSWSSTKSGDFCALASARVTIIKEVEAFGGGTASTQAFSFTATNLGTNGFSLVDNDQTGPDRISNNLILNFGAANAIIVTESQQPSGWTLADLTCVETGGIQNTSWDFASQVATIIPEPGESIVCTYRSVQTGPQALANVTIIKEVQTFPAGTASTQAFSFTATNFGPSGFTLVDNDQIGPDRVFNNVIQNFGEANAITVTESQQPAGWRFVDVTCVETGGIQNTTENPNNFTVNIIPEAGESIVCTYRSEQIGPTAAAVSISGRATLENSRAVAGATMTLTNVDTGETRTIRTDKSGHYIFNDVSVGSFYVLTIRHKSYHFEEDTRSFTLNDQMSGVDFVQSF